MALNQVADMLIFHLKITGYGEIPQYEFKTVLPEELSLGQKSYDNPADNSPMHIVFENKGSIN